MEFVYFTTAGLVLYFFSSWILTKIELIRGKKLPYRDVVFFAIIFTLATASFNLIQHLMSETETPAETPEASIQDQ